MSATASKHGHSFSVSEVLHDGRVLVFTYARRRGMARVLMQVYEPDLTAPLEVLRMSIPAKEGKDRDATAST